MLKILQEEGIIIKEETNGYTEIMQKLSRKDNITLKAKKKRKNEKTNHHSNRRSTHTE